MKRDYGGLAGLMLVAFLFIGFVLMLASKLVPEQHTPNAQSWDQENLKQTDHGCPSAIFIAPRGELTQC